MLYSFTVNFSGTVFWNWTCVSTMYCCIMNHPQNFITENKSFILLMGLPSGRIQQLTAGLCHGAHLGHLHWRRGLKESCPRWCIHVIGGLVQVYRIVHTTRNCPLVAAAAKSLQSCPTLCDSIDGSPPGSPVPGILQARTLEWVAVSFSNAWKWKGKVKLLSHVQLH